MRNLKRALSLAVASVMLLGMMVVGTGAAYSDVSAENNEEAIAVVTAAGIMGGTGEGFAPEKNVTRNEFAVIISNLMEYDIDDYAGAADFTDVPAWAEKYVSACYANGLVAGKGNGLYGGNDNVTNAEAGLMLLKVLGYFQYGADFGDDWKLAVIKQGDKIDLFDGVAGGANTAMTRDNVAQLVLNVLESSLVYVDVAGTNGTTIKTDGVDITIPGTPAEYDFESAGRADYDKTTTGADSTDGTLELIEKLHGEEITKNTGTDLYGRASTEWKNEDQEVVAEVASEPDYVLVAKEDYASVEAMIKDMGMEKKFTASTLPSYAVDAGEIVELWVSDDDSKAVTADIVYKYLVEEITKVEELDEDIDEDEIEAGASVAITFGEGGSAWTVTDIELDGFDAKTYVKGAYVLFPATWARGAGYSKVVEAAHEFVEDGYTADIYVDTVIADTFDGKVQGIGSDYVKVDGVKYNNANIVVTVNTEYTFIKDVNGVIIAAVEVDDSTAADIADVIYVQNVYNDGGSTNKYGQTTTKYYAQVVTLAGEVKEILVGIDGTTDYGVTAIANGLYTAKAYTSDKWLLANGTASTEGAEGAVNYKGVSQLVAWSDADYVVKTVALGEGESYALTTDTKTTTIEGTSVRFGAKASFILVEGTNDDLKTEVKAGAQKITLTEGTLVIAKIDNGVNVVNYVIVPNGDVSSAVSYEDVIYVDASASIYNTTIVVDDEDVAVDVFEAYDANGKKVEITVLDNTVLVDGFFTYEIEDGIYTLTATDDYTTTTKTGDKAGTFTSYYGTEITLSSIADMETEGATWIDLHETDAEKGAVYTKVIKNLEGLKKAVVDMGADLVVNMYIDDDAAMVVVITDAPAV